MIKINNKFRIGDKVYTLFFNVDKWHVTYESHVISGIVIREDGYRYIVADDWEEEKNLFSTRKAALEECERRNNDLKRIQNIKKRKAIQEKIAKLQEELNKLKE